MAEAFTVSGLTGSTTYHFAIKAFDEVGNGSVLSNIVTVTTAALDTTAPEAISDLAGRAVAMGGTVELSDGAGRLRRRWRRPIYLRYVRCPLQHLAH